MTTEYTINFGLALPDFRMGPWHDLINTDIKKIDSLLATALSAANVTPWANNTHYVGGISVLDETDATVWMCVNAHTSALAPTTFAQDRAAHPTYWTRLLTGFAPRGEWTHNTTYFPYDLVYQTNLGIFALCTQKHVSNPSGTIENDAAFWAFLCDFSDIGAITANAVAYSNLVSPTLPNTNVQSAIDTLENQTTALNNVNIMQGNDIAAKVAKAGDTMTGDLIINKNGPTIYLNKPNSSSPNAIAGRLNNIDQWHIRLGNDIPAGNFSILRFNDAGAFVEENFYIVRATGNVGIGHTNPGAKLDVNGPIISRGDIRMIGTAPTILIDGVAGQQSQILSTKNDKPRWIVALASSAPETGGNAGSDFAIARCNDAGAYVSNPIHILRASGNVGINNVAPTAQLDVTGNVKVSGTVTANGVVLGASGWKLLNTLTASNSPTLLDTTSLTAANNEYEIVFENVLPATNNDLFRLRVYVGGAVQSGANSYIYMMFSVSTLPSSGPSSGVATEIPLSLGGAAGVGNNVSGLDGTLRLSKPSFPVYKDFWGQTVHDSFTQNVMNTIGGAWHGSGAAIDGLEFSFAGGNIWSGVVRIYGR